MTNDYDPEDAPFASAMEADGKPWWVKDYGILKDRSDEELQTIFAVVANILSGRRREIDKAPFCYSCEERAVKAAYNEDGWMLYWTCSDEDCLNYGEPIDYIDWPFGERAMVAAAEMKLAGFRIDS